MLHNFIKILIYIIIQVIFLLLINSNIAKNNLVDNVYWYDIYVEISDAILQIYNFENGQKIIINEYPIEIFLIYDALSNIEKNFNLLKYILDNKLKSVIILDNAEIFNIWCPSHFDKKSGFLRGETFAGKIILNEKEINFRLYYNIQDADGFNLEKNDKRWPFLADLIQQNKVSKTDIITSSKIKIILKENTLKKRIGYITERTIFQKELIDFYNEIYTLKPSFFMMFEKKKKFQLLITELPYSNYYYTDLLKNEKNIDYLIKNKIKLYNEEWFKFIKNWSFKLENLRFIFNKK